uniref:Mitochondrial basic amino acids transporter n=1 Tax=Timema shepardi TaxID=629360 RepID=A0A7R9AMI9_TIMSH|nr:unnamed protein product [Timema shepardi]
MTHHPHFKDIVTIGNIKLSLECKLYNHVPPSTVQPKSRKAAYQHLFEVPSGLDRRLPTLGKIVSAFKICYERSLLRRDALVIASRLEPWRSSNTGTLSSTYTTPCSVYLPIAHLLGQQDGAGFYRWMHRRSSNTGNTIINLYHILPRIPTNSSPFRTTRWRWMNTRRSSNTGNTIINLYHILPRIPTNSSPFRTTRWRWMNTRSWILGFTTGWQCCQYFKKNCLTYPNPFPPPFPNQGSALRLPRGSHHTGCAGVLVGHPFDTVKVCLQTQDFRNPQYRGTIHCVSSLLKKEGMKGLYKGMSSPMSGVALVNAIVFGVNGNVQRRMSDPDSMKSLCLAGASAGFVQSFVCSPMELVKTRIQIQQNNRSSYKNPLDCLVKVARTEGYRHGVFKGLGVTILRDVPAVSSYFLAYELMTRSYAAPISTLHMLIAGGLAGTFSWVVTYPVDVIKSRLQADGVGKYDGLVDCFRKSVRSEGFSFLTRGLTSTVLRAFPTNAATFTVVTWVFRWCNNHPTVGIDNSVYCVPMSYEDYVINVTMRKDHSTDNILGVKVFSFKEKKDGYLRSVIHWRKALLHGLVGDFNHHLQPMKERPANKVGRVDLDEMESKVMALFFKNVGHIHFESRNVGQGHPFWWPHGLRRLSRNILDCRRWGGRNSKPGRPNQPNSGDRWGDSPFGGSTQGNSRESNPETLRLVAECHDHYTTDPAKGKEGAKKPGCRYVCGLTKESIQVVQLIDT